MRDVQHALAREGGHENWAALTRTIEARGATDSALTSLLQAAGRGDAESVAGILDAHPGLIDERGSLGASGLRTALHFGVHHEPVVRMLLDRGANPDIRDAAGATALDVAALSGRTAMAEMLLAAGAHLTLPAALALGLGEDAERLVHEDPESLGNRLWARILVQAAASAPGAVLDRVISALTRLRAGLTVVNYATDPDVAVDGAHGYTALHQAGFSGNLDAVRVLLRHGANPRIRETKWRSTPAGWARYAGHADAADLILEADVDVFDAIDSDRADVVARVLDRDPGAVDRPFRAYASFEPEADQWWPRPGATPLEWATERKKTNAAAVLIERGAGTRSVDQLGRAERIVSFLQSACWDHDIHGKGDHRMYDRAAQRILANEPSIAADSLYTAIVCGEIENVRRVLAERPQAARQPGGARGWTPILYLAYTRFSHQKTIDNAVDIARLLFDAGADPDDFYMAGDAQYSVLVGVACEGEQDSPRQPYAEALFDLVLARGAKPFDIQVLYDTHFSGDMLWWLKLVHAHTIDTPLGAAWRDPDWKMFDMGGYGSGARFILEVAIKKRNRPLAEWALACGANPNAAPARDKRFPRLTLYELAVAEHMPEMAELLRSHGAVRSVPVLDQEAQYVDACLTLDRACVDALLRAHPEYRTAPRAMFEAARRDRPDAIALLLDAGVPIEVQDPTGKRTLHEAAISNAVAAARFLIECGAEIDPRESTYGGAPIGWAAHADHQEMIDLLSARSRNIWVLCFRGYVDRVGAILSENPSLAQEVDREGCTPLWWLPDDERKAAAIVELLLAAGADPARRNSHGNTAASWARRRGMTDVAARLDSNESRRSPR